MKILNLTINFILLCFFLLNINAYSQDWSKVGQDIPGFTGASGPHDKANAVSISEDGKTIAIAAYDSISSSNPALSGETKLYTWNGSTWIQKGASIWGDVTGFQNSDKSGYSLSLSNDGNVVAIGVPHHYMGNYPNNGNYGRVKVFEWNGSAWILRGNYIDGLTKNEQFGSTVALSDDGNVLVAGAYNNTQAALGAGAARVYAWTGNSWVQLGTDLFGQYQDNFGVSVSISSDGTRIAIGASQIDPVGNINVHHGITRIYELNGNSWSQLGANILGKNINDYAACVSLSGDGGTVIIGAFLNADSGNLAGSARVFSWNGFSWEQKGNDIDGESPGDKAGYSVSINDAGDIVAVGAILGGVNNTGQVRVYKWNGVVWFQQGQDIEGVSASDLFGNAIELNNDGTKIIIGANSSNASGVARVYSFCSVSEPTITLIGDIELSCDLSNQDSYQWLNCDSGNSPIVGANNQNYTFMSIGNYAVETKSFGCVDTSSCIEVITLTINEIESNLIQVYPNPVENLVTIDFGDLLVKSIEIVSIRGQLIEKKKVNDHELIVVDLKIYDKGIYFIKVQVGNQFLIKKVVKQ
jgi:hypothetical protein